jgi:NDP-sugar pyrophosphorylase family protein
MIPKNKFFSTEKQLFEKLALQGKLGGYIFNGPWYPTDTLERYELAIKKWK